MLEMYKKEYDAKLYPVPPVKKQETPEERRKRLGLPCPDGKFHPKDDCKEPLRNIA